jgi:hypothetical protein
MPDVNIPGSTPPREYRYMVYELDLSTARNNVEFATGEMNALAVQSITDINANLQIRFQNPNADLIDLTASDTYNFQRGTDSELNSFQKIFITNDAVTSGSARLVFAFNVEIHKLVRITSDVIQQGILQQVVTIGIVATPIPAVGLTNRINLLISNGGANTIYVGSSTVTVAGATQGIPIASGQAISFTVAQGVVLYGIAAVANDVNILEGA